MSRDSSTPVPAGAMEAALGRRFRASREAARLTQSQVADHLGITVNTLRWHEGGARMLRLDVVARAADLFGHPRATLLEELDA